MDFSQIASIATACIVSAGGVGGIAIAVIKFSSNIIAEKISAKYENKLEQALEKYKTELSKKEYVSKTRFDAEFEIYRNLAKSFFTMVKDISVMIPYGYTIVPADKEARKKADEDHYNKASNSVVNAQDELNGNAPFISESFYNEYKELLEIANKQLVDFSDRWNVGYLATEEEKERLSHETYKRTKELQDKLSTLNSNIRKYLSSLDVIE